MNLSIRCFICGSRSQDHLYAGIFLIVEQMIGLLGFLHGPRRIDRSVLYLVEKKSHVTMDMGLSHFEGHPFPNADPNGILSINSLHRPPCRLYDRHG